MQEDHDNGSMSSDLGTGEFGPEEMSMVSSVTLQNC